jgi:hypothetical protein
VNLNNFFSELEAAEPQQNSLSRTGCQMHFALARGRET